MLSLTEKNAAVLAFSGICAKTFDFAFRTYYSVKLGAEGVGLLALGFGLHGVMPCGGRYESGLFCDSDTESG